MVTTQRTAATEALLDAIGRALGADRVLLLGPHEDTPTPRRRGWLWRAEPHRLVVPVPGEPEGRRLVVDTTHEPSASDRLVARLFVRLLEGPVETGPDRPSANPRELLWAARTEPDVRPEAMLRAVVGMLGAKAGGLALATDETRTWTVGLERPVLRTAALEALEGGGGRIEVSGRMFVVRRWTRDGEPAGAIAVEGEVDRDALGGAVAMLSALLAPPPSDATTEQHAGEADLRDAVAAFPAPAIAVDAEGRLVAASAEAAELFGITEFDVGKPAARATGVPTALVTPGTEVPDEVLVGDRYLEPFVTPLSGGGRLVAFSDRSVEEDLRRAQERLVAAMAHELRTPIAGVKALLEVLKLSGGRLDQERVQGMVVEGIREISNLERLVEDLLLTTRSATGGIAARADDVGLRPIVDDVVAQIRARYADRHIEVTGDVRAHADPTLIRHALWHLIDNAAKFSPPDASVSVELAEEGEHAEVRVTDRGPGIYSGDLPNLFRPFQRLDRNTISQHGGSGVGLYLVQELMTAQHGEVHVRSRLGHGSTFRVSLPAVRGGT